MFGQYAVYGLRSVQARTEVYHSILDCPVLSYCPQSHVLFVNYKALRTIVYEETESSPIVLKVN